MKKLLISLFGLTLAVSLQAQTVKSVLTLTDPFSVLTSRARVSSLTVLSPTTTTLTFYDTATTNILYATGSYYGPTNQYTTNFVVTITNSLGNIQSNYFSGQYTLFGTVATNLLTLPAMASIAVSSNVPVTLPVNLITTAGLAVSGATNSVVIVTYR